MTNASKGLYIFQRNAKNKVQTNDERNGVAVFKCERETSEQKRFPPDLCIDLSRMPSVFGRVDSAMSNGVSRRTGGERAVCAQRHVN